jgi:hypothetical protein
MIYELHIFGVQMYYFESGVRVFLCNSVYVNNTFSFAEVVSAHRHADVAVRSVQPVNKLDETTLRESCVPNTIVHLTHRAYQTQRFLEHESYVV